MYITRLLAWRIGCGDMYTGGESFLSTSEDPVLRGPLSGLMKLLRSKGAMDELGEVEIAAAVVVVIL